MPATMPVTFAGFLMAEIGRGVAVAETEAEVEWVADEVKDVDDEVEDVEAEVDGVEVPVDEILVGEMPVDEAAPMDDDKNGAVGTGVGAATEPEEELGATEAMAVIVLLIPIKVLGGLPVTAAKANCPGVGKVTKTFPN